LYTFDGTHGAYPNAGLIADANGNLFGTTAVGGPNDYGTVFEIVKTASGYASTPTVLVAFDGANGAEPFGALMADANGNLFGTTAFGGAPGGIGYGTVFEIVKTATGYASTHTILARFDGGANGASPFGALMADANGNLFGTTRDGGSSNLGTVFEILKTASGYVSTPTILASFDVTSGVNPTSGVIADANGNLFGTTTDGVVNRGIVFEILKTAGGYASTPTVLFNFLYAEGGNPFAGLIADANGNLFGTTIWLGALGYGTVFKIVKTASGYASTPTVLYNFDGTVGAAPYAGLIADANGNLFGATGGGGANDQGTVFELSGSGFVPPLRFTGVPGTANCNGVSTSTLARTYGGIAAAARALGYASVAALQSAIAAYCGN